MTTWVEVEPTADQPVPLCPPVYRSPASIRARAMRCPACGWFRTRFGHCANEIYVHAYGVWEHR